MKTKIYAVIVCLLGLPGMIGLLFQGMLAFDYWIVPNSNDSMIHRAVIGVVNEPFLAIMSMCSALFMALMAPILFLVARNGAKVEELENSRQIYSTATQELYAWRRKYIELVEDGIKAEKKSLSQVFVIMPSGVGNVLAWSYSCWPSREAAQQTIDNVAQGDEEYKRKFWIMPLNVVVE